MAKTKAKKTNKRKEVKELHPIFLDRKPVYRGPSYPDITLGIIFILLSFLSLTLGTIAVYKVNAVIEYIPTDVYYPNLLISFLIGLPLFFWVIILFSLGVLFLADDFSEEYNEDEHMYNTMFNHDY